MGETRVCAPPAQRVVGRIGRAADGAVLLCIAGIHGNEPAGIVALRRVVERLERARPRMCGELVALVGNLRAIARGERFLDADLNRIWMADRLDRLQQHRSDQALLAEEAELLELRSLIEGVIAGAPGPVYFLDMHTTSGASGPFGVIGDTLPNRAFALQFPVPIILGVEEQVEGTLPEHAYGLGCITMGFEAGQHADPASVDRHESAILIALHAAGIVNGDDVDLPAHRRRLGEAAAGAPRFLEVRRRHPVAARNGFRMLPGFSNFQPVEAGRLLAYHNGVEVRAPESGRIFLPLYQDQGDDGFFIARPVRPFWLRLSALLRHLRLDGLAPWLPGVRRHPERPNAVVVDPHIARWHVVEIFHLLGYRQRGIENGRLVFARRAFDTWQRRGGRAAQRR